MLKFVRNYSLVVSKEVRNALNANKPVVALESTILTHGLPFPKNLSMAQEVEEIIRSKGCTPATTAFIKGQPRVGLSKTDLELLSDGANPVKVSRRDIPYVVANKLNGGTTIASTLILANKLGIKVFATGGLGGVHRKYADLLDVSADLEELSRTPMAVVCSGPKSILDVPSTIEYLETKGVLVATMNQQNVPGFFCSDSGVKSPYVCKSSDEAAQLLNASLEFGSQSGLVFCVPAPAHLALPNDLVNTAIDRALQTAEKTQVIGKDLTPYLLKKVWEATNGKSVDVNVEFVKQNAAFACEIAKQVGSARNTATTARSKLDVLCIGGINEDITAKLNSHVTMQSSNPAEISTSLGGTAYNVALAAGTSGCETGILGTVDSNAKIADCLNTDHVDFTINGSSSKYVSVNDSNGELIVGCSNANTNDIPVEKIKQTLETTTPKVTVFDGNLSKDQIRSIVLSNKSSKLIFEPTSVPKARKLALKELQVFPNNSIYAATPNLAELNSMVDSFVDSDMFDISNWLPVLLDTAISTKKNRSKLHHFSHLHPSLAKLEHDGVIKTATRLLPFIPNLFVTLGSKGVLSLQLLDKWDKETQSIEFMSTLLTDPKYKYAVRVRYFPAVQNIDVKSVNGAGDSFCGVLAAGLALNGVNDPQLVLRAIKAANLSLLTNETVHPEISTIHEHKSEHQVNVVNSKY